VTTEPGSDFGGAALQEVVAVNGLSIPKTVSSLSISSCSIAEDITEGDTVNNSTTILTCRGGAAPPGSLCALASISASGMRTKPSCESSGAALGRVVAVNRLSFQVIVSSGRRRDWLRRVRQRVVPRSRALTLVGLSLRKSSP